MGESALCQQRTLGVFSATIVGSLARSTPLRLHPLGAPRLLWSVSGLHHVALGTQDVARLARFYVDVLELREVKRHLHADGRLRSVWLDLGGPILMLEASEEAPRVVIGVGAGPFLIALSVAPARRDAVEERLRSAGCAIESRTEWTSYTRDPDGNRIAFSSYPLG